MTSVALVLGAGGRVGAAYHAGSLAALHEVGGWDARRADLIVGTSAGSTLAATLRDGLAPGDHLARADGRALTDDGANLLDPLGDGIDLDLARRGLWLPLPASPRLAAASVLRRGRPRPGLALAGLLPRSKLGTGAFTFKRLWGFEPEPLRYRVAMLSGGARAERSNSDAGVAWLRAAWRFLPLSVAKLLGPFFVTRYGPYFT
jgi:NTE family protein